MSAIIFTQEGPKRVGLLPDPRQLRPHTYAYWLGTGDWVTYWGDKSWNEPGWIVVGYPPTDAKGPTFQLREKAWYRIHEDDVPAHLKAWMLIL